MDHSSSGIVELVPLVVTGGACLLGLGLTDQGEHHGDPFRWPTIVLLFVASMAHVPMIPAHLDEAPYMGALFIAFAVAAFAVAALLAARPSPALYPPAGLLCAAAVVAYAATRLVPFPQLGDDVGDWLEPLGIVAVTAEAGVVLLCLSAERRLRTAG